MKGRVLKVKEWLKYSKPNYDGFIKHVETWDREGIPYGIRDLLRLAQNYRTPIPAIANGRLVYKDQEPVFLYKDQEPVFLNPEQHA